jgi:hypothetical protein
VNDDLRHDFSWLSGRKCESEDERSEHVYFRSGTRMVEVTSAFR